MSEKKVSSTFKISDVSLLATKSLPEIPYHEAVSNILNGPIESCSRYHGKLVANVVSHPLIAALHGAFITHRPITLSPDIIWLTMTQGLATHINQNAERLRQKFVSHEGKLTIEVRRDDFIKGSPENPWPEVFSEFANEIHDYIGNAYDLIVADFSTTGPVERAASEVVLFDSVQSYFDYEVRTMCGIPEVTLEGTVADWESIASRVEKFVSFELDWWVKLLVPLLKRFIDAASGLIDEDFWNSIYKYLGPEGSGSPYVSGWISTLFPYLQDGSKTYKRNQWIDMPLSHGGPLRAQFPNAASRAPFKWKILESTYDMEFIGGLIGVVQCPKHFNLRPEIGWAIRDSRGTQTSDEDSPLLNRSNSFYPL